MGHILDTEIKSENKLPNKGKLAKLRSCYQRLENHLYFPGEYFLIIMTGVQYKSFTWSSTAVKIAT